MFLIFCRDLGPRLLAFSLLLLAAATSCQKSKTASVSDRQIDACTLISQEEVQSVQGAPIKEVKSSANTNSGFRTADCLYTSEIDNQSVSLALIQKNTGSPNGRDPKEYWKVSFSRHVKESKEGGEDAEKEKAENSGEREEVEKNAPAAPKRVDELGDEAFWASSFSGGALYVLKGNAFIRISIAGSDSEESKMDKSKALAAKALARF